MTLNLECAINSLSFGNISVGVINELLNKNIDINLFPIGGNIDLTVFDKLPEERRALINISAAKAEKSFKNSDPYLKIWHINGSVPKLSKTNNSILTFHETDSLTPNEVNILNSFDNVFVTSSFSKEVFKEFGVKSNVIQISLGFDNLHYNKINVPRPDNAVIWGIFGKVEVRKRQGEIIRGWVKKYGGNKEHRLHVHITNPFLKPEEMNGVFAEIFEGKQPPFNVVLFPFQPTNTHMNHCYNAIDIVLDGSRSETISLPSLTCVGLGKHALVHNAPGIQDWATNSNSIKVESTGMAPCYDGKFFNPHQPYNQGNFMDYSMDEFCGKFDDVLARFKSYSVNNEGSKLATQYSYSNGVNKMVSIFNQ